MEIIQPSITRLGAAFKEFWGPKFHMQTELIRNFAQGKLMACVIPKGRSQLMTVT
jgi:hypothetical protein